MDVTGIKPVDVTGIKPIERDVEIINPETGAPLGIRLTMISMDDPRMKQLMREITDQAQKLARRNKNFNSEQLEQNTNAIMYRSTLGWTWYNPEGDDADTAPTLDGESNPPFNKQNYYRMLDMPWFKRQLNDELEDTNAFFAKSGLI